MTDQANNPNVDPEADAGTPEADAAETQETPTSKSAFEKFLYHQRRAAEEAVKALAGWIPPEVREHAQEAQKELMSSFKVLADSAAETIEYEINRMRNAAASGSSKSEDKGEGPSTTGKTKVKVEVS
ncbi:MAG: hypothetical protein U0528_00520 [Anaerolineae bacterium]|nr:hypothetical protein [Anaerolineae bacterium]